MQEKTQKRAHRCTEKKMHQRARNNEKMKVKLCLLLYGCGVAGCTLANLFVYRPFSDFVPQPSLVLPLGTELRGKSLKSPLYIGVSGIRNPQPCNLLRLCAQYTFAYILPTFTDYRSEDSNISRAKAVIKLLKQSFVRHCRCSPFTHLDEYFMGAIVVEFH